MLNLADVLVFEGDITFQIDIVKRKALIIPGLKSSEFFPAVDFDDANGSIQNQPIRRFSSLFRAVG
ncbi:MAG TPA: hypothetical protein VHC72_00450 [Bryobacteraceae bacterium]|nr:hypothetical protein [Bryobacteraceae bacterium]